MTGIGRWRLSENEWDQLRLLLGRLQDGDHFDIAEMAGKLKHQIRKAWNVDGVVIKTRCGEERQIIPEQEIAEITLDGNVIYHGLQGSVN